MHSVATPDMCELAFLRAGHTSLSCELDTGKPASNFKYICEPGLKGFHSFNRCENRIDAP